MVLYVLVFSCGWLFVLQFVVVGLPRFGCGFSGCGVVVLLVCGVLVLWFSVAIGGCVTCVLFGLLWLICFGGLNCVGLVVGCYAAVCWLLWVGCVVVCDGVNSVDIVRIWFMYGCGFAVVLQILG